MEEYVYIFKPIGGEEKSIMGMEKKFFLIVKMYKFPNVLEVNKALIQNS